MATAPTPGSSIERPARPQPSGPSSERQAPADPFQNTSDQSLGGILSKALGLDNASPSDIELAILEELGSENIERITRVTDLLLPFVPVAGAGKDVFEAVTGNNMLTGERLTPMERGLAVFGAVTIGAGTALIKGTEAISKVARGVEGGRGIEQVIGASGTVARVAEEGTSVSRLTEEVAVAGRAGRGSESQTRLPGTAEQLVLPSSREGQLLLGGRVSREAVETTESQAFFWSGQSPGINSMKDRALEIARNKGGKTLEALLEERNVRLPSWNPNDPVTVALWRSASEQYASGASGTVHAVLGRQLRPGNIWETIELPALRSNPNVKKIVAIDPETGLERVIFER